MATPTEDGTDLSVIAAKVCARSLLPLLVVATFLVFVQAFMVAPILPSLARDLGSAPRAIGWAIPAYLVPYGAMSLFFGRLSDRVGRAKVLLGSMALFSLLTAATASAHTVSALVMWRALTGAGASGIVPTALTIVGDVFPYGRRGRPLGWIFAAMAAGAAFGASLAAMLEPSIGWRALFAGTAGTGLFVLVALISVRRVLPGVTHVPRGERAIVTAVRRLLATRRGQRTYGYVLLNGTFHSGVYSWLGVFLTERFNLRGTSVGLALLGYGVPGILLGPALGRLADRYGRNLLLPLGFMIAAMSVLVLAGPLSLVGAVAAVTTLSLGFDMTQPLLAGIVTTLEENRGGLAMGFNVLILYIGAGLGSLAFGELAHGTSLRAALLTFGSVEAVAAVAAFVWFRGEHGRSMAPEMSIERQALPGGPGAAA